LQRHYLTYHRRERADEGIAGPGRVDGGDAGGTRAETVAIGGEGERALRASGYDAVKVSGLGKFGGCGAVIGLRGEADGPGGIQSLMLVDQEIIGHGEKLDHHLAGHQLRHGCEIPDHAAGGAFRPACGLQGFCERHFHLKHQDCVTAE
jgi:hypothetical protein